MPKISFIGAGHITEMLLNRILLLKPEMSDNIATCDVNVERVEFLSKKHNIKGFSNNIEACSFADYIFVCVPPQVVCGLLDELRNANWLNKSIVSIAGGVPMSCYSRIGKDIPVFRALPNPPSSIGEGIIPFSYNKSFKKTDLDYIVGLFSMFGECVEMNEEAIGAVTSLSSPASVFLFIDTLVESGVLCGISREKSLKVAFQTVKGCIKMMEAEPGQSAASLLERACTPGGISIETIFCLDKRGFRGHLKEALLKGAEKAWKFSSSIINSINN